MTRTQILLLTLSLVSTALLYVLLRKTFLGKALRATMQDREAAALAGIDIKSMNRIAFALGGLLIGLAGPLFGRTTYLYPAGGTEATLIAVIITIFAGIGRTRSILVGGWFLGMVESTTAFALGSNWREGVSALLLIALLIWKPRGIFSDASEPS